VLGVVDKNPDLVKVLLAACRQENVEHRRQALEIILKAQGAGQAARGQCADGCACR